MNDTIRYILELKDKISNKLKTINSQLDQTKDKSKGVADGMGLMKAAAAAFVASKFVSYIGDMVAIMSEAEVANKSFENVLRQNTDSTNEYTRSLGYFNEVANKIQENGIFSSETVKSGLLEGLIRSKDAMGASLSDIEKYSKIIMDVDAGFSGVNSNAGSLRDIGKEFGKSLREPMGFLNAMESKLVTISPVIRNQITKLVEQGKLYKAQKMAIDAVADATKGQSDALANTTAGLKMMVTNEFQAMVTELSTILLPVINLILKGFISIFKFLKENKHVMYGLIATVTTLGVAWLITSGAITTAIAAVVTFGASLNIALMGIPLLIGAIVTGIAWLAMNWDFAKLKVIEFAASITDYIMPALLPIAILFDKLMGTNITSTITGLRDKADAMRESYDKSKSTNQLGEDEKNEKNIVDLSLGKNKDKDKSANIGTSGAMANNVTLHIATLKLADKFIVQNDMDMEKAKVAFMQLLTNAINDTTRNVI